jgi:predicted nuclease of predicted toxin-antitoxin system
LKVLFDHNVPHKLRHSLDGHVVSTTDEMGWAELENGQLLRAAEESGFEVMITGDKNLTYQQNLLGRKIALVVLSTNNWNIVKLQPQLVLAVLTLATPGSFQFAAFL